MRYWLRGSANQPRLKRIYDESPAGVALKNRMRAKSKACILILTLALASGEACRPAAGSSPSGVPQSEKLTTPIKSPLVRQVIEDAIEQTGYTVSYDPSYVKLSYPGGDVPQDRGVCSDVVVRAFRKAGVDLQKEVHEDMAANFAMYPRKWHRTRPDSNIDHRRVPNLQVFFNRKGDTLPITDSARDYAPGDLVTWDLGGGLTHIGIVVDSKAFFSSRNKILHNIGAGPKIEDVLFNWTITGHYRYFGPQPLARNSEPITGR